MSLAPRNNSGTLFCRGSRLHIGSKHWATHTGQTPMLLIHSGILFYPRLTPSPGAVAFCQKPLAKSHRRVAVSLFSMWLWRLISEEWLPKRDPKKRGCCGPEAPNPASSRASAEPFLNPVSWEASCSDAAVGQDGALEGVRPLQTASS